MAVGDCLIMQLAYVCSIPIVSQKVTDTEIKLQARQCHAYTHLLSQISDYRCPVSPFALELEPVVLSLDVWLPHPDSVVDFRNI